MNCKFAIRMLFWGLLGLFLVFVSACRSSHKTAAVQSPKQLLPTHWFTQAQSQRSQVKWLTANFSASYVLGGEGQSFQGQLRMQKDAEIWMNITKLGLEIIRLRITPDSLFVWNRLERTLLIRDQKFVRELTGMEVSLAVLQDLLLANYFLVSDPEHLLADPIEEKLRFRYLPSDEPVSYSFRLHPQYFRFEQLRLESREGYSSDITYSQFEEVETRGIFIPRVLEIRVLQPVDLLVRLNYQKVTLNQPQNMPFSVPESVKRI